MSNNYQTIQLVSVDEYGLNFEIAGTHEGNPYRVSVSMECDGRDVDIEPVVDGEYNPNDEDMDWFDDLCQDPRFLELQNAGYKAWEAFPAE